MKKTILLLVALLLFPAICSATYFSGMTNIAAAGTLPVSNEFSTMTIVNTELAVEITNQISTVTVIGGAIEISNYITTMTVVNQEFPAEITNWITTFTVVNDFIPIEIINQISTCTIVNGYLPVQLINYVTTATVTDSNYVGKLSSGTAGTFATGNQTLTIVNSDFAITDITFESLGGDTTINSNLFGGTIYIRDAAPLTIPLRLPTSVDINFWITIPAATTLDYVITGIK